VQELASIDFRIYYRPETQNGKPDTLSRRSEYCPEKGGGGKPADNDGFGEKSLQKPISPHIHLLLSPIDVTPNEEMERGIPSMNQGRREKRQGL